MKRKKLLHLKSDTLRALSSSELPIVAGGAPSKLSRCCSAGDPICNVTITC